MSTQPRFEDYPFEMRPLSPDEGGGYLVTWPDLPGCMADGETIEEALEHGEDAFRCWMQVAVEDGRSIPEAGSGGATGRFVQRMPKSLHARLAARAKAEGVSLNTLVISLVAEGLGRKAA